jgi:hypothetical protein
MSKIRHWQRATDRRRATAARAELRALVAHINDLKAARAPRFVQPSKQEMREAAAHAVAEFHAAHRRRT